ncbi:cytochrome c-type biogenesis protein CcmH [Vibrio furnissii]|uniref:cytochrome c-type biogenesis protein n=1 Tax=Vibrio furnissii TaxID=29494 RepID=UPI0025732748|nr:cytochrome c-type biogenesis protein [Vibrio furnissii]WJG25283.1 cytochrome c-type biogenesis protein CcmH [Vibrio furnissii]
MKRWILAAAAALMVSFTAMAAIDVYDFESPEQETQFQELSNTLRCPKCQNNSIADSNAELAKDLRHKVYEMTKEGKSKSEIVDYMIARYGNFVTYNPPFTLSTAILWLAPLSVLLIGFGVIVIRSRRSKAATASTPTQWDTDKEVRLKALLDEDKDGDQQS